MLLPVLQTATTVPLLTTDEAKAQCRIDGDTEDTLIDALVAAVTSHLKGPKGILAGRGLVNETWVWSAAKFPDGLPPDCDKLRLPLAPLYSMLSVTYLDANGVSQTLATSVYAAHEDFESPYLTLKYGQAWPATYEAENAVTVTFVAGYGATAADVPAAIRQAAKLILADWYEHRETVAVGVSASMIPLSATVKALLGPYVRMRP